MQINTEFEYYSNLLMYGVITSYVISLLLFAVAFGRTREREVSASSQRLANVGFTVAGLGTLLLGAAVLFRSLSVARVPWGNMYEFTLSASFGVMAVLLFVSWKRNANWLLLFVIVPVLLALMVAEVVFYTDASPLIPALRSYWLVIHVSAAVISAGAFMVSAVFSGLQLLAERAERRSLEGGEADRRDIWAGRLPSSKWFDEAAYRIIAFTFPLWTFTIVAGAIWARAAWSRFWGWDPKETWAFITWVGYAAYLHARVTIGWKGRRSAVLSLIAFGTMVFNFTIVNLFFTGLHTYSGK